MPPILLTGMSGTGKSTLIRELRARGFRAIDMDEPGWSSHNEAGHQIWNERRLQEAIGSNPREPLFIAGCAENQVRFYPRMTAIILLSAPEDVLLERLRQRTDNPYGKTPEERAEILRNLETIEPLLRRSATCEIETTAPVQEVLSRILDHCRIRLPEQNG